MLAAVDFVTVNMLKLLDRICRTNDPYSVVLRRKKLPMGLLQEPDKVTAKLAEFVGSSTAFIAAVRRDSWWYTYILELKALPNY